MTAPQHFEVMDGYSLFRLSGHGSLEDAASKVVEAITFSREKGMRNLLVDTTNWTGHGPPSVTDRFRFALLFVKAAMTLKVALVVRPEMMRPDKFEVTVAKNRGMLGNVFDSETEALAWLLDYSEDQ
ncbi:MAG TPA: hypothetical protein VKV04_20535 [Verrucomicrobiae bacterium]|nr:hypothetical protein [Verrucomicrobiae bacterium]